MSSLQELVLSGVDGNVLQAEQMEALFGRFNKTLPLLERLTFSGFNVRGCLAPLIKSLRFFPNLRELWLEKLNSDEHEQCSLLKSFGSLTRLDVFIDGERPLDSYRFFPNHDAKIMKLSVTSLTPAAAATLGRLLPDLPSLQELSFTGLRDGRSILQAEEMKALFGGFNKTVPLYKFTFTDFSVRGCLFPLFRSFRFFPNLVWLELYRLNLDEQDLRGLLESFQFIPNLKLLSLACNPLDHPVTSIVPHVINLKKLQYLRIYNTGYSEKDLNYVQDIVQEALPDLKIVTDKYFVGTGFLCLL